MKRKLRAALDARSVTTQRWREICDTAKAPRIIDDMTPEQLASVYAIVADLPETKRATRTRCAV